MSFINVKVMKDGKTRKFHLMDESRLGDMDIESRLTRKSIWKRKWMKVEKKDDDPCENLCCMHYKKQRQ